MIKILHISDWHGMFLDINEKYDIVVCSGDLMPNRSRGNVEIETAYQPNWIMQNVDKFKSLTRGCPFLFCAGNHDYIDPCSILVKNGIDATNIENRIVESCGLKFYGFPWVPYLTGEWNYECTSEELLEKTNVLYEVVPWKMER